MENSKELKTPIYVRKAQAEYRKRLNSQGGLYNIKNRERSKKSYYKKKFEKENILWLMQIEY